MAMGHKHGWTATSPTRVFLGFGVAGLVGLAAGAYQIYLSAEMPDASSVVILAVLLAADIFFFWRVFWPKVMIHMSVDGIWTEASGQRSWQDVQHVAMETHHGYKGAKQKGILIQWHKEAGLPVQFLAFSDLNTTAAKAKSALNKYWRK